MMTWMEADLDVWGWGGGVQVSWWNPYFQFHHVLTPHNQRWYLLPIKIQQTDRGQQASMLHLLASWMYIAHPIMIAYPLAPVHKHMHWREVGGWSECEINSVVQACMIDTQFAPLSPSCLCICAYKCARIPVHAGMQRWMLA